MSQHALLRPRLLVIDDDPRDVQLVIDAFHEVRPDAEIITTTTGLDGLMLARRDLPDLILLDLILPTESGLEVLQALKRDELAKRIPIVVLSGHPFDDLVWSSYHAYAAAFLAKPASYDKLVQVLRVTADFWFSSARLLSVSRASRQE